MEKKIPPKFEDIFVEENRLCEKQKKDIFGPYTLIIDFYKTGEKTWEYTKATILKDDDKEIGSLCRNYLSFPYCFFKKNDDEYWMAFGLKYYQQHLVNLNNFEIFSNPNDDQYCTSTYFVNPTGKYMVTLGCYWGGDYFYRFYNISDPKNWLEIKIENVPSNTEGYELIQADNSEPSEFILYTRNEKWISDDVFSFEQYYEYTVKDGVRKSMDDLFFEAKDGNIDHIYFDDSKWQSCSKFEYRINIVSKTFEKIESN